MSEVEVIERTAKRLGHAQQRIALLRQILGEIEQECQDSKAAPNLLRIDPDAIIRACHRALCICDQQQGDDDAEHRRITKEMQWRA